MCEEQVLQVQHGIDRHKKGFLPIGTHFIDIAERAPTRQHNKEILRQLCAQIIAQFHALKAHGHIGEIGERQQLLLCPHFCAS